MIVLLIAFLALVGVAAEPGAQTVVFDEPGFPSIGIAGPVITAETIGGRVCKSSDAFIRELETTSVVIWRHGSAFPAEAWPAFVRFLERGGSWVHLGGAPLVHPVVGEAGARIVQPRTLALLEALGINQCRTVKVAGDAQSVSILEPRLTDARDYDDEDGSAGPRDGVIRTLMPLVSTKADRKEAIAAAAVTIDRLRGRFAGGNWTLFLLGRSPTNEETVRLLRATAFDALDGVRIDPTFACFHAGEQPSLLVRRSRPAIGDTSLRLTLHVGERVYRVVLAPPLGQTRVPLTGTFAPGYHAVVVEAGGKKLDTPSTGFWVFDEALFRSGHPITTDGETLRRDGKPMPLVGTTVMSRTVHRKFLFEPNAAVWDATFRDLAARGIDFVRTGLWTGFRKASLDAGHVDESFLRALEAYYLTARRHGVAVLFTFFAFVPPAFGADNPYLDPRAVEGQRALVAAIVGRFGGAREILWDLINEPSFANPEKLWVCRPVGDRHGRAAFRAWLAERFADAPGGWEAHVRARWRLTPDAAIDVPTDADFAEPHLFGDAKPYRARDWLRFAQHAFTGWADRLRRVIDLHSGSGQLVTVGQDEGGLIERPHPQLHAGAVDFTSIHTWWLNDALLWDAVCAKAPGKPLLVSETGVMGRERLDGSAHRSEADAAALLSRKIGYAFAGGACGVVQWCLDVNPYMPSDNEVAIGARRADGSVKPELAELTAFASFIQRNRERLDGRVEPDTVVLIPHADGFPPRGVSIAASQRVVDLVGRQFAEPLRAVSSERTATDLGAAAVILLPTCRGLHDDTWRDLRAAVERGATLVCGGYFEADDAGLPAHRIGTKDAPLRSRPLAREETAPEGIVRFPRSATESVRAADRDKPATITLGKGRIVHHPLPLDLAEPGPIVRFWFATAVGTDPSDAFHPFVVRYRNATLVIAVNEASVPRRCSHAETTLTVPGGHARMLLFDAHGRLVDRSHPE